MSGKKGMIRYSEEIKEQVRKEVQAGQSQREISRRYGISGYTVQSWCGLRPETKLRQAAPLRKGRPGKIKTIEDYEKENKRLKMENELPVSYTHLDVYKRQNQMSPAKTIQQANSRRKASLTRSRWLAPKLKPMMGWAPWVSP